MDFSKYTKEELVSMKEVFVNRRAKLFATYSAIQVNGSTDIMSIVKRKRIGRVLSHCDNNKNQINNIVRPNFIEIKKNERYSKRNKTIAKKAAKLKSLYEPYLPIDPSLPKFLIGNITLREEAFDQIYTRFSDHHRLEVFAKKGLKCIHPECNKVASRLLLTMAADGGLHYDLFTNDFSHMNVDHIIPLSKGGADIFENKQPMCAHHNSIKSNKLVPY